MNYNTKKECEEYIDRMEKWCYGSKVSPYNCKNMKEGVLNYCKNRFDIVENRNLEKSHSSSLNNSTCFSDKHLGGNTLKDTIKSPETSGEREKPFPLIIFSSQF